MYLAIENMSTSCTNTRCSQKLMPAIFLSPYMSFWNNHYITEVLEHSWFYSISCNCVVRHGNTTVDSNFAEIFWNNEQW